MWCASNFIVYKSIYLYYSLQYIVCDTVCGEKKGGKMSWQYVFRDLWLAPTKLVLKLVGWLIK